MHKVQLTEEIKKECKKLSTRHYSYLSVIQQAIARKSRRTGIAATKTIKLPAHWAAAPGFDPFKVAPRADVYAHSIARAIRAGKYTPRPAAISTITKEDGTPRELNIFQIADSAVSKFYYNSLLTKNLPRFSSYAYAYRPDRSAHDAVLQIHNEWRHSDRIYVAEFDFSKFFERIRHQHLFDIFDRHGFIVSDEDRNVILGFLNSSAVEIATYSTTAAKKRTKGIPQGTSISLFLANAACYELDRSLERLGVGFARYADDTVIWSESYAKIVDAYQTIKDFSETSGIPINTKKSLGIHLVSRASSPAEMRSTPFVEFLGYQIGCEQISIKSSRVKKIQKWISYLIYQNLLQPLHLHRTIPAARLAGGYDHDYITALRQIRSYMYGSVTDTELSKYKAGAIRSIRFKGLMSYYPIVNDEEQLKWLDGWLVHTLTQSLRKRSKQATALGIGPLPGPSVGWHENILMVKKLGIHDARVPSFLRINRAMKLAIRRLGVARVANPLSPYYS